MIYSEGNVNAKQNYDLDVQFTRCEFLWPPFDVSLSITKRS